MEIGRGVAVNARSARVSAMIALRPPRTMPLGHRESFAVYVQACLVATSPTPPQKLALGLLKLDYCARVAR
jgi:hypothetical protein